MLPSVQTEGYVLQVEADQVLVVHNIAEADIEAISAKSLEQLMSGNLNLTYYYYEHAQDFQKGDKVKIWTSGDELTSYPSKTDASKIKKIDAD